MNTVSRKSLISLASAAILMVPAVITQATTRYVPSQYGTIQSAINASVTSDTIVVAAGTYRATGLTLEVISWVGKDLTIQGAGAGKSIIDGQNFYCCLSTAKLTTASRISGFTFQNGNGIAGGMLNTGSNLIVTNCAFNNNRSGVGAGICNAASNVTVTNCTFTGNLAEAGGGIGDYNSSRVTVANCIFTNNSADGKAADGGGGAIFNDIYSYITLTNCTIAENDASNGYGGALYNNAGSATMTNCILWGNIAATGSPEIYGSVSVSYSDVQGLLNTVPDANHNFGVNPLFVNAATGNLRLQANSPCINRGNAAVVLAPPFLTVNGTIVDMDGNPRTVHGTVDLGAYELQPPADVTGQFSILMFPPSAGNTPGTCQQVIMLSNKGPKTVTGPIYMVLNGLTGYTLTNATGLTNVLAPAGRPYINTNDFVFNGTLPPGPPLLFVLQFTKTGAGTLSYSAQIVAGPGAL